MAKSDVAEKEKVAVPAVQSQAGPPAELAEMMRADKGKGVSTSQSDNLVPLVYILQPLSPQVARRNPAYIEGAEPGMFWLRNAPVEIHSGDDGILVQPCYFMKDWVEWRPRDSGGGFVARHQESTEDRCPVTDAVEKEDANKRVKWIRPNGNEVIQTRSHVVRIFTPDGVLPYIIPFSSTGHTTSKAWSQLINTMTASVGFAGKYRLTTRERTNPMGTWFGVDAKFESWCTPEEYKAGKQLYEAFASGAKAAEAPVTGGGGSGAGGDDEIPF